LDDRLSAILLDRSPSTGLRAGFDTLLRSYS
jgi:hypothetical protein